MIEVSLSFHGHSNYSDGLDSIKTLVLEAARLNFDYFGISDHNTTEHIPEFYQVIEAINSGRDDKIIPISTVEVALWHRGKRTDILFASPGDLNQDFLDWINLVIKDRANILNILPIVEKAISDFNVLVVIPHPGMPLAPSATFNLLNELSENLSPKAKRNLGVEIRNWSSNILPNNSRREKKLVDLAADLDIAEFGLADYHSASSLKSMYSVAHVEEKTPQGLIQAVQNRKVHPIRLTSPTKLELINMIIVEARALIRLQFLPKKLKDQIYL